MCRRPATVCQLSFRWFAVCSCGSKWGIFQWKREFADYISNMLGRVALKVKRMRFSLSFHIICFFYKCSFILDHIGLVRSAKLRTEVHSQSAHFAPRYWPVSSQNLQRRNLKHEIYLCCLVACVCYRFENAKRVLSCWQLDQDWWLWNIQNDGIIHWWDMLCEVQHTNI